MSASVGPTTFIDDSLVLHLDAANSRSYPGTGTAWNDLSGNGNNGELTNGPTYNNGILSFDGVNDIAEFGDVLNLGTNNMTINAWISLDTAFSANSYILSKARAASQNYRFGVAVNASKQLFTFVQGNGGADRIPTCTTPLLTNVFYMVTTVITRNSNITTYVNSVAQSLSGNSTISQWNGLNFQSTNPFRIGSYTAVDNATVTAPFKGTISAVQMYHKALTAAEVRQNFISTKSRFNL